MNNFCLVPYETEKTDGGVYSYERMLDGAPERKPFAFGKYEGLPFCLDERERLAGKALRLLGQRFDRRSCYLDMNRCFSVIWVQRNGATLCAVYCLDKEGQIKS